jgi:ribosomal protein L37AE/L43A
MQKLWRFASKSGIAGLGGVVGAILYARVIYPADFYALLTFMANDKILCGVFIGGIITMFVSAYTFIMWSREVKKQQKEIEAGIDDLEKERQKFEDEKQWLLISKDRAKVAIKHVEDPAHPGYWLFRELLFKLHVNNILSVQISDVIVIKRAIFCSKCGSSMFHSRTSGAWTCVSCNNKININFQPHELWNMAEAKLQKEIVEWEQKHGLNYTLKKPQK